MHKINSTDRKWFKETFDLNLDEYWSATGFDIVKFNENFIFCPEGVALITHIDNKFGKEVSDRLVKLCYQDFNADDLRRDVKVKQSSEVLEQICSRHRD